MTLEQEILAVINQIVPTIEKAFYDVFVMRHPGHPNQKTHGNRFGGFSATKESLRRLRDDKGARERYKESARKKAEGKRKAGQWWEDFMSGKVEAPKPRTVKTSPKGKPSAPKSNYHKKYTPKPQKPSNPLAGDRSARSSLAESGGRGAADVMSRRRKR
jgi:hypothetical protein